MVHTHVFGILPFLFRVAAAKKKRPSMTSTLATEKTSKGPDGSVPEHSMFLFPVMRRAFLLPLSVLPNPPMLVRDHYCFLKFDLMKLNVEWKVTQVAS